MRLWPVHQNKERTDPGKLHFVRLPSIDTEQREEPVRATRPQAGEGGTSFLPDYRFFGSCSVAAMIF